MIKFVFSRNSAKYFAAKWKKIFSKKASNRSKVPFFGQQNVLSGLLVYVDGGGALSSEGVGIFKQKSLAPSPRARPHLTRSVIAKDLCLKNMKLQALILPSAYGA